MSEFACVACNRRFAWSEAKAGRRARCRCGAGLTIPAERPEPGGGVLADALPDRAVPAAAPHAAPDSAPSAGRCGTCGEALAVDAVLCVNCGIDPATGRQFGVKVDIEAEPRHHRVLGRLRRTRFEASPRRMLLLQIGLGCQVLKMVLLPLTVALGIVVLLAESPGLLQVLPAVAVLSSVLATVGFLTMYATPFSARGAVPFLEASAVSASLAALLRGGLLIVSPETLWVQVTAASLHWASYVFYLLFLRVLAVFLGFDAITEQAGKLIKLFVFLTVLAPFAGFLICIGPLALLGLMVYAAVLYVRLVIDLFNGVNDRRVRLQ